MKISNFIGASSVLLLTWLGITFLHEVPSDLYPHQDRTSSSKTTQAPVENTDTLANAEPANPF